ncbi:unnamed protein product [Arctia plantaginis]|uniref:Odorant receptor n=1 Tax=Arctia plantaginis TaxID=874455 RepID=A0A8S0ZBI4_ARCPL|nr:unnamed protein product [Arctia plantaginis]
MWENLRKFNLDHCDLPTMLWNVAVGLRVLTLNIERNYDKGIPIYYYILTFVITVSYFYVFLICMIWFVFIRCRQTGDLTSAMVVLSLGISSEIGTIKLLCMFIYVDKIKMLVDEFLECDAQTVLGDRFRSNLLKTLRVVKKRALLYWTVIVGNGILYLLKPVVMPGKNLPENHYVIYGLEPMFETPNYEIACAIMTAGVFFICYVPASATAYLIVIVGYIEAQLLALSEEVLQIWPDAVKNVEAHINVVDIEEFEPNTNILINKYVEKRLKEIIIRHALIKELFLKIEDIFKGAIAIGFLLLVLGLIAELLGKLENTFLQMPFAFMQVAMDCFNGQRVMDACVVFEEAVYDCQWEKFNKANMKMVLIMLQNAQKTMTLSAGGIAMLNFTCLMSITRGIYSAYTALRSTF